MIRKFIDARRPVAEAEIKSDVSTGKSNEGSDRVTGGSGGSVDYTDTQKSRRTNESADTQDSSVRLREPLLDDENI